MSAPDFLTRPDDAPAGFAVLAAATVIGASYLSNRYLDATTPEQKGYLLVASGASVLALLLAGYVACDGDTRGFCGTITHALSP